MEGGLGLAAGRLARHNCRRLRQSLILPPSHLFSVLNSGPPDLFFLRQERPGKRGSKSTYVISHLCAPLFVFVEHTVY